MFVLFFKKKKNIVLLKPSRCRDVSECNAKTETAREQILVASLGSGADNNPNATRTLGLTANVGEEAGGGTPTLVLERVALGSRLLDKPAPTEPPAKEPMAVYIYFLIGFGALILAVFIFVAISNLRIAAEMTDPALAPPEGTKPMPRTLTFRAPRSASDLATSPLSGKLTVTEDESDADNSMRRVSRADGDAPPAWQPPPGFDAVSPPSAPPPEFVAPMLPPPPLGMPVTPAPPPPRAAKTGAGGHISSGEDVVEGLPKAKVGDVEVVDLGKGGYSRGSKGWKKIDVPVVDEPAKTTIMTSQFL